MYFYKPKGSNECEFKFKGIPRDNIIINKENLIEQNKRIKTTAKQEIEVDIKDITNASIYQYKCIIYQKRKRVEIDKTKPWKIISI